MQKNKTKTTNKLKAEIMKQFTITLPNNKIDNNGSLKARILQAAAEKLPFAKWHGVNTKSCPLFDVEYAGPKDKLTFGLNKNAHFAALNKRFWNEGKAFVITPIANKSFNVKNYNADSELDKALLRIQEYADFLEDKERDPGYDFMFMGQPVRIYQKFIQIGNNIIPTTNTAFFKREENKPIINIIVNISKTKNITNIFEA